MLIFVYGTCLLLNGIMMDIYWLIALVTFCVEMLGIYMTTQNIRVHHNPGGIYPAAGKCKYLHFSGGEIEAQKDLPKIKQ